MTTLYREFTTQAQLDAQYDPSGQVADPAAARARRVAAAAATRASIPHDAGQRYGDLPPETLDIFPSRKPDSPVVVFIHGGYWSTPELVKETYSWVVNGLHANDFTAVVLDYGVCPDYTIAELTAQCRRAVAWVHRNAARYNGSPDRIYVTGHSAGGHLSARIAQTDWQADFGLPADLVKGACPISGLFDLRPFPHTWLQPKLKLTAEMAEEESPLLAMRGPIAPMLIAWGADETGEFARQAEAWRACCEANGTPAELLPLPGCLHSSAIEGFGDPSSLLCRSLVGHLQRCIEAAERA